MAKRKFNPFDQVSLQAVPSSTFDLSHDVKTSFQLGKLIPLPAIETYPGDSFHINIENMFKFAPLIASVMHRVKIKTQAFFVPNRLIWEDFPDWIRGNSELEAPYIEFTGAYDGVKAFDIGTWADYLGYPTRNTAFGQNQTKDVKMSPLPIYAAWKVWFDWYRSNHLSPESNALEDAIKARPGQNLTSTETLRDQCLLTLPLDANYELDYFTAALPEPQNGDPVLIPLFKGGEIDPSVYYEHNPAEANAARIRNGATGTLIGGTSQGLSHAGGAGGSAFITASGTPVGYDPGGTLKVDLSALNLKAGTIHDLTYARVAQNFLDRQMRAGNSYRDFIYAHFQVRSDDATIQRAEFLGSLTQNMLISEVLSTAETEELPQGNRSGSGLSVAKSDGIHYYCKEHGWIIMFMYAVPDTAYFQGLHRSLFRFQQLDYMIPGFANIGEQPLYNKELFVRDSDDDPIANDVEWGYLPIYSDLRYIPSKVTGEMRTSLLFWHWARAFTNQVPALSAQFVTAADVTNRTFAVTNNSHKIYAHVYLEITASRKLPKYGVPRN